MDSRAWLVFGWLMVQVSPAWADEGKLRVTVAVAAEPGLKANIEERLRKQEALPVEVRVVPLPFTEQGRATAIDPSFAEALSAARARYVEADFEGCLSRLPAESAWVELFARGDTSSVSRILMYTAACQVGRGATEEAQRAAQALARFGLELPSDVGAVTPDVERMLTEALKRVRALPRPTLRIESSEPGLRVAVDGRSLGCLTPCAAELPAGDHVVSLEGDGFAPHAERVTLSPSGNSVRLSVDPASPELAAEQWGARYATSASLDSADSMRLLAQAVRASRLVLLSTEPARDARLHLRGAYGQAGAIAARAGSENLTVGAVPKESVSLLEDLLIRGKALEPAPPIWKSVWFWASVGVVAAGAATTTALLLQRPEQRTQVGF